MRALMLRSAISEMVDTPPPFNFFAMKRVLPSGYCASLTESLEKFIDVESAVLQQKPQR